MLVRKTTGDQTTYYVNAGYEELRVGGAITPRKYYTFGSQRVAMTVTGTLSYLYSGSRLRRRSLGFEDEAWAPPAWRRTRSGLW